MSKYRKGNFYVRKVKESDKAHSFIGAIKLMAVKLRHGYVLVRHGYPGYIYLSGFSKREVWKGFAGNHYKQWNEYNRFG